MAPRNPGKRVHHEVSALIRALLDRGWTVDRWTRHGILLRWTDGKALLLPKTPGANRWRRNMEAEARKIERGGRDAARESGK